MRGYPPTDLSNSKKLTKIVRMSSQLGAGAMIQTKNRTRALYSLKNKSDTIATVAKLANWSHAVMEGLLASSLSEDSSSTVVTPPPITRV